MTNEQIDKAKNCENAEALLSLARENGIEMTPEEAEVKFAELHLEGELSDDELDSAAGGGNCGGTQENGGREICEGDIVQIADPTKLEWGGVGTSCVCCCSGFRIDSLRKNENGAYGKLTCMGCGKNYAFRTEYPYDGESFRVI